MPENLAILATAALTACVVSACDPAKGANSPASPTLYGELGGIEGIRPIVDELTWRLVTDELLATSLATVPVGPLKEQLLVFLCAISEGPCLSSGKRPLISFSGSPSAAARRVINHVRQAALARGARSATADRLGTRIESNIRAFIGKPR